MEQESLLTDVEFTPVLASTGKRFLNYLIDIVIFYLIIIFVFAGLIINNRSNNGFSGTTYSATQYNQSNPLLFNLIFIILIVLFFTLCEILFKGRTIGKFITGTKAVNQDGTSMTPKTVLLRSLSRIVPFEAFSALGNPCYPWHDKWTKTFVIDVKKTAENTVMPS